MDTGVSDRISAAMLQAMQHWEHRRGHVAEHGGHALSIAVCRQPGALGTSVAREIGRRLGWQVYDHELLERISQEMNVRVGLLESVDERHVGWLQERMEAFASVPHVSENTFARHLLETILSIGAHGHAVIVGRGAPQILPSTSTLRVYLVACLEDRVRVKAGELGVSEKEAARQVESIERERLRFVRDHFHRDPADLTQYDLIVNTSRFTVAEAADLVIEALRRVEARGAAAGKTR